MIVIVTGSRDWTDRETIRAALCQFPPDDTTVFHGDARGADTIAAEEAASMGFAVRAFPADWKKYGRRAGPIRNGDMADAAHYGEAFEDDTVRVLAFPLPKSAGTWDMVRRAEVHGWEVQVHKPAGKVTDRRWPPMRGM